MKFAAQMLVLGLVLAGPALADPPPPPAALAPAPFACDGQIAILYHNKISPGGSLAGIAEAAKAQEAWYRAHGVTDNKVLIAKIVKFDPKTKQSSYAADEVYTLHVNPPSADKAVGKKDYAELYKKNATVLDKKTICLPKY